MKKDSEISVKFKKYLAPDVLLGMILLLGAVLRLYDLSAESYWIDEMSTIIEAQQSIPQMITSGRLDQPPAFYIPFHFWIKLFGATELNARLFSALVGTGSIMLIFSIGRELFGKKVGLLSAFMMAISGFQIYYSQIARFYSFFELMALLSFLLLIRALRMERVPCFILYTIANLLMIYSHTFGIFVIAAQNLFFLLQLKKYRGLLKTWILCQITVLITFIPYIYILTIGEAGIRNAIASNVGNLTAPTLLAPLHSLYQYILPSRRLFGQMIVFGSFKAAGIFLMGGISIYIIRLGLSSWVAKVKGLAANLKKEPDITGKLLLVGCWLLCPILLPFIISFIVVPVYKDYYTISAAPALYLLLAFIIDNIREIMPLLISLGVLVIMVVPGLQAYYVSDVNEQWREAAAYIEENSAFDDVIVFAPNENTGIQQRTFDWYYKGSLSACGLGVSFTDSAGEDLTQCVSGHERFWVVMRDAVDDLTSIRYKTYFLDPDQTDFYMVQESDFVGISVYLFELKM